jgi:hypothetical protein
MLGLENVLSLSWIVPIILESMMIAADGIYKYFVESGLMYTLIGGWLLFSLGLNLIKMNFSKDWLGMFGFSGGGELVDGKMDGMSIGKDFLKPILRAVFAIMILLQLRPGYMTRFIIDPFLQFGAIYTNAITDIILPNESRNKDRVSCPDNISVYLSKNGCEFITGSIGNISNVNAQIIKRGLDFVFLGDLLNVITGIFLMITFFSSNFFTAMIIIEGIFKFGVSLMLYPLKVIVYVVKKDTGDKWIDPWPVFGDIIKALQKLVISLVAICAMLLINIAVAGTVFYFDPSKTYGFGEHSITWISSLVMFLMVQHVFRITREQMVKYIGDADMTGFYSKIKDGLTKKVTNAWNGLKDKFKSGGGK